MAQCPIRTRAGPNRLSTLPTLMPATCSTKWRRGRHAPEHARHGRRASNLHVTRRLSPCCSKTERLCVSLPPSLAFAHPGALPPRARTSERGRHGRRHRAPRPPPSARLWREPRALAPSPSPAMHVEPLSHLPPSPVLFILGAADVAAAGCRGRTATSRLGPSWVALWVRAGPLGRAG